MANVFYLTNPEIRDPKKNTVKTDINKIVLKTSMRINPFLTQLNKKYALIG